MYCTGFSADDKSGQELHVLPSQLTEVPRSESKAL